MAEEKEEVMEEIELDFTREEDWPNLVDACKISAGRTVRSTPLPSSREGEISNEGAPLEMGGVNTSLKTSLKQAGAPSSTPSFPSIPTPPTFKFQGSTTLPRTASTIQTSKGGGGEVTQKEKDESSPPTSTYGHSGPHIDPSSDKDSSLPEGPYPPPASAERVPFDTVTNSTVFVGKLPKAHLVSSKWLTDLLSKYGTVKKYRLNVVEGSGNNVVAFGGDETLKDLWRLDSRQLQSVACGTGSSFAFVEMSSHDEASRAIAGLAGTPCLIKGSPLKFGWGREWGARDDRKLLNKNTSKVSRQFGEVEILNNSHNQVPSGPSNQRPSTSASSSSSPFNHFRSSSKPIIEVFRKFTPRMSNGYPAPSFEPQKVQHPAAGLREIGKRSGFPQTQPGTPSPTPPSTAAGPRSNEPPRLGPVLIRKRISCLFQLLLRFNR